MPVLPLAGFMFVVTGIGGSTTARELDDTPKDKEGSEVWEQDSVKFGLAAPR